MGKLDKFKGKEPKKDQVSFIGDFLLGKYSFEEYCKFYKVSGFEAEKEYNDYQDRRLGLISEHEKRGGKVLEVPLYYDEYLEYAQKHNLCLDQSTKQLYIASKAELDMEKA